MKLDKTLSLLGLAMRARALLVGESLVLSTISKYPQSVIFLASDAGQNIQKKIQNKATTYQCTIIQTYTKDELSHAIGKSYRTLALCTDQGFNKTFKEYKHI
jgi:ribosomal protein L7Ae-like RNA K-turn-binding protein